MLTSFLNAANNYLERMRIDGVTEHEIEQMVKRNKFSEYLPYRAYNEKDRFYSNSDDSTGFLWELQPLVYASKDTHSAIEGIFNNVPTGTVVQVMLYADQHIDHIIDYYLALRSGQHQTNRTIAEKTAELFRQGSRHGFEKISRIPARHFRAFIAVKLFLKSGFSNDTRYLRDSIHETLKGCGLMPKYMAPQALCQTLQRIFNDQGDVPNIETWKYNDQVPIHKQVIMGGTRIHVGFNNITIGTEKVLGIQSIKEYPKESLDDLTLNRVMGGFNGPQDDGNQCNMPFWVSVNIIAEDLRHKFHGKSTIMMQQETKGSGAGYKMDRQNEMLWATQQADRGERFVRVIPSIITFSKNEKAANENTARVKRLWENQGFSVNKDRGILAPMFLLSLPFGLHKTKNNIEFLERDRIMPTQSAARMLPLQGDFTGFGKPVTMLVGRKGQIVPIEFYNEESENNNALITATSGSGKTFLMNRLLADLLSTGVLIRAFDLGRGYEKLSQILGGNFICFDRDSKISVNPYTTIRNIDEEIDVLSLIISQMVWSSSEEKPGETQKTIINIAARQVWNDYGTEGEIDQVKQALQDFGYCLKRQNFELASNTDNIKALANELAFNLSNFTGDGPYARWFKGKSTLDIEQDRFVVLEIDELLAMQELCNVVIMQVVNAVTRNLYLSDRQNPRTIVFDEAHKWFKEGSFLGEVVENGYRLARKYHGGFITIFQSMLDLRRFGKSGDVLNENSAYKFFLKSKTKYDKAVEEKLIDLDPFMLQIANSIRLEKGRYSEVLLETPLNKGVARLPVDPFTHWVFTSDPKENAIISKVADELGVSKIEAIKAMCGKEN